MKSIRRKTTSSSSVIDHWNKKYLFFICTCCAFGLWQYYSSTSSSGLLLDLKRHYYYGISRGDHYHSYVLSNATATAPTPAAPTITSATTTITTATVSTSPSEYDRRRRNITTMITHTDHDVKVVEEKEKEDDEAGEQRVHHHHQAGTMKTTMTTNHTTDVKISSKDHYDNDIFPSKPVSLSILFDWNWIDPNIDGICGFNKCFFHGKSTTTSSSRSRPDEQSQHHHGYLVAYNNHNNMSIGYDMAMYIESKYGLHHLYDSKYPPIQISVTHELVNYTQTKILPKVKKSFYHNVHVNQFMKRLDSQKVAHGVTAIAAGNTTDSTSNASTQSSSISSLPYFQVQRVKVLGGSGGSSSSSAAAAVTNVLEWGDNFYRNEKCQTELSTFVANITDITRFVANFMIQRSKLKDAFASILMMEYNSDDFIWFLNDFQILIDGNTGIIYHIDLDRKQDFNITRILYPKRGKSRFNNRTHYIQKKSEFIIGALQIIAYKVILLIEQQQQRAQGNTTTIANDNKPSTVGVGDDDEYDDSSIEKQLLMKLKAQAMKTSQKVLDRIC